MIHADLNPDLGPGARVNAPNHYSSYAGGRGGGGSINVLCIGCRGCTRSCREVVRTDLKFSGCKACLHVGPHMAQNLKFGGRCQIGGPLPLSIQNLKFGGGEAPNWGTPATEHKWDKLFWSSS